MSEEQNRFDERFEDGESEVKEMTAVGKVIGIFISPTAAFRALKVKHEVVIPLVLIPLVMVLYYILFWNSIATVLVQQMEDQYVSMGIDVMPGMIESALNIQRIVMPITVVVTFFIGLAVSALVYWICGLIAKADFSYGEAFVMSSYVSLISLVTYFIMMLMTGLTGSYDLLRPMTSAASFLPDSAYGEMLYYALLPFEVVSIWSLFVTYIGLLIYGRFSKKAATISVIVVFILGLLMSVGSGAIAMLFSGMAG